MACHISSIQTLPAPDTAAREFPGTPKYAVTTETVESKKCRAASGQREPIVNVTLQDRGMPRLSVINGLSRLLYSETKLFFEPNPEILSTDSLISDRDNSGVRSC